MEYIPQILEKLDISTLIAIAAMFWIFHLNLNRKFEKIDQKFEKIELKLTEMSNRINDLDKRLVAVETTLRMKDCCLLKDNRIHEKAE